MHLALLDASGALGGSKGFVDEENRYMYLCEGWLATLTHHT